MDSLRNTRSTLKYFFGVKPPVRWEHAARTPWGKGGLSLSLKFKRGHCQRACSSSVVHAVAARLARLG